MERHLAALRTPVLFTASIALCSFLFSFLSWGRAPSEPSLLPRMVMGLEAHAAHMVAHAALGALAAAPTRRLSLVVTAALSVMFLDVDHVGAMLGLPMVARASHCIAFMATVAVVLFVLARKGAFGRDFSPVLAGSIAVAVVLSHVTLDALAGSSSVPLWSPLSRSGVGLPAEVAVLFEVLAVLVVWVATNRCSFRGAQALVARSPTMLSRPGQDTSRS